MASSASWSTAVADALGPVTDVRAVGAGVWRCRAGATEVAVKAGAGTAAEARGLRRLGAVAGGPGVPEVLHTGPGLLVTAWVPGGRRTPGAEERLGRDLARLHASPWPSWGGGSSSIGACPVDPASPPTAARFYGDRMADLAGRCGLGREVGAVVARLPELLGGGPPTLVHGDLWWGNVVWGADGRGWVIDPSDHGGHPEEDLAMLALFGAIPDRLLAAYREARPLAAGWEDRVELFQIIPLLVHTVLFGGGYRASAEAALRRYR